jgi:hypothetical protein
MDEGEEGLRVERMRAYILRVARWVSSGLNVSELRWSSPGKFKISKLANPWAKIRNQNRNPRARNLQISTPNPNRCHP